MSVSVLILTLNEERNLPACLESVRWCDDVVVLDSFSSDRTVEIAKNAGARVFQRPFDDWSAHQNWALENIPFKHRWVYYSDADEVIPEDLRDELLAVARREEPGPVAYRLRYKNYFCGRWLRHCGIYPVWVLRFFRPEKVRWTRVVNPMAVVDGDEGRLQAHFLHYTFNNGLTRWFDKHNRYSCGEAVETIDSLQRTAIRWRDGLSRDPVVRRRFMKELSFRLPLRPQLRFLYMYVFRLGFLDGWAGYTYCRLLAIYEYMIVLKVIEMRRREQGLTI